MSRHSQWTYAASALLRRQIDQQNILAFRDARVYTGYFLTVA